MYHQGDAITAVYFPLTCVVSQMMEMKNGETIEIATVGNEGVIGLPAYWGIAQAVALGITQISGEALRTSVEDFKRIAKTGKEKGVRPHFSARGRLERVHDQLAFSEVRA